MIYALRRPSDGAIKLGYTRDLYSRYKALTAQHGDLELLGVISGDMRLEKYFHRQFAAHNIQGDPGGREWFYPHIDVLAFVRRYTRKPETIKLRRTRSMPRKANPHYKDLRCMFIPLLAEKELRDRRRYRQKEICKATGLSPQLVSKFIRNEASAQSTTLGTVMKIARWLDVRIDDVFVDAERRAS